MEMKTVMITLDVDIPDTELKKPATVTIEGRTYTGVMQVIIIHEMAQATGQVTLKGVGLETVQP